MILLDVLNTKDKLETDKKYKYAYKRIFLDNVEIANNIVNYLNDPLIRYYYRPIKDEYKEENNYLYVYSK